MKYHLSYAAIAIVLLYALYNGYIKTKEKRHHYVNPKYQEHIREHLEHPMQEELQRINTPAYTKSYIIDVINHGSTALHFKKDEVMEGGFASSKDAPMIACFVMSLSGESCGIPYAKEAEMYFSSNCAGCHGTDGKGLNGTYPDLTRRPLLGIEKRKEILR